MAWYNITCRSGGSNMNPGASDGAGEEPAATRLTNTNGGWNSGTGVFTCSGAPDLSGLVVGWLVSITPDADTVPTTNQFTLARIASFDNTAKTVTVTGASSIGTIVSTAASGRTLRVGGACQGPNGAVSHPLNFGYGSALNPSGTPTRYNLKNDQTYSVTASVAYSQTSARVQGYTSTFGDGGKFVLDGGTSGASYTLLTMSGANSELYDAEIRNNGATGTAAGLSVTGALCDVFRVTVHDVRGHGISQATGRAAFTECLAYACNQSNTVGLAGFTLASSVPVVHVRCVSRDNVGSNSRGFTSASNSLASYRDCVADTNGAAGWTATSVTGPFVFTGCDFYANGGDGLAFAGTTSTKPYFLTDCNFVANGGYGVNGTGAAVATGLLQNCGFGSGTAANSSGATNALGDTRVEGSVTYDSGVTPWNDPANGDFTVALTAAKGTGTGLNFSPTVSYPDRAAAQGAAA